MALFKYSFFTNSHTFVLNEYSSNSDMEIDDEYGQKRDEESLFDLFIIFWYLKSY
jgi:hypothetical protein